MKTLQAMFAHFLALSVRERVLTVAAGIGMMFLVVDLGWVRPHEAESKALQARIEQQRKELDALADAVRTVRARTPADPLERQRAERDELRALVVRAEGLVGRANADTRLGDVIRPLAAGVPGLTLLAMKTLPMETVFKAAPATGASAPNAAPARAAATDDAPLPTLYRHGIEVTVRGRYADLVPWLHGVERSAPGLFWGPARLDAAAYPDSTLKLTLYALSVRPDLPLE